MPRERLDTAQKELHPPYSAVIFFIIIGSEFGAQF
jgi:hypothetical protein